MSLQTDLIDYLRAESRGKINLSVAQANKIIELVTKPNTATAVAKVHKYSPAKSSYDLLRVIETTDDVVKEGIVKALETPPVEGFYRYDCYNSKAEFEGKIFSIHNNLFQ